MSAAAKQWSKERQSVLDAATRLAGTMAEVAKMLKSAAASGDLEDLARFAAIRLDADLGTITASADLLRRIEAPINHDGRLLP